MNEPGRRDRYGLLKTAVLEWAQAAASCQAPAAAFVEALAVPGVAIPVAQARTPMGMAKQDHIRAVVSMPPVAGAWQARFGPVSPTS